jgi:hypothetical protein
MLRDRGYTGDLIGVDAHIPYLRQLGSWGIYDKLEYVDILKYLQSLHNHRLFTIYLLMDVLEHFEKSKGKEVLDLLNTRLVFLSTPLFHLPQEPWRGNPYEEHKCFWTREELEAEGFEVLHLEEIEGEGDIGLFVRKGDLYEVHH